MFVREHSEQTGAELEIRRRIETSAAITFAEFMDVALYHPDGYYANRGRIGAGGDYFTSPVAHPAFGALACVQLETMWQILGHPDPFWVIEAGAGDGVFAADIVNFANSHFPRLSEAIRYITIDRTAFSDRSHGMDGIEWIRSTGLPVGGVVGCVLSNELLDAMPVHRFVVKDGRLREVYVELDTGGGFSERFDAPSTDAIAGGVSSVRRLLQDGFRGEFNPRLSSWVADVAVCINRGFVVTIDYGYEREELYSNQRNRGTFQTYYRHTEGGSPYQRIGRQDMTAHVDFTALIDKGRESGLRPVFLTTQGEFLDSLGYVRMEEAMRKSELEPARRRSNVRAMRRLIDPDGLGKFKVLVQERDSGIERSADLVPSSDVTSGLRAPQATRWHLP